MEEIIAPVPKELLKAELTEEKRLRFTHRSNNEIYIVTAFDSPNVMREIGRLREIAFRAAGGGTGKAVDIDEFDTMENPYKQLIVWNPECDDIIGGYRYIFGRDVRMDENGEPMIATAHGMFTFSEKFMNEILPYTVELGRAFVALEYQSSKMGSKSIFALDNLWDGLGALTVVIPNVKYLFGKVTMYPTYLTKARDMILYFLKKHFADPDGLVVPTTPLLIETPEEELAALFNKDTFKEDYRTLKQEVHKYGLAIPPMVNAYMGLSPTMRIFGTAVNRGFGNVEETGLLIAVNELQDDKRMRYIESFAKENPDAIKLTSGANKVFYPINKEN
ncbi:MAG: GNAT family N-acetyltransferase [Bacteroidaceae bacterium]|nr:GNAT family N-acetyltransferase [Bacteroidales bacterium]MBO5263766.1 GNAT family N-acetyltransferase [Bacteroidaceae bacterium]MBQ8256384.1 GNAT family N-acetyltransferase [Bacteroidaceae bacterium]